MPIIFCFRNILCQLIVLTVPKKEFRFSAIAVMSHSIKNCAHRQSYLIVGIHFALNASKSCFRAPCLIKSLHKVLEFLTKLPRAPAALALVFSSWSLKRSTKRITQGLKCTYSTSLWKPALPTAKQANFLVFRSGSLQHSMAAAINPNFNNFS